MKYGVIDVGSNSVRLMLSDGVKTLYKRVKTTRLAEGMVNGYLQPEPILRTADAINYFYNLAKTDNVDIIWCFATAAVRQSKNGKDLLTKVKSLCGLNIEVVSGEKEAELGICGALNGSDGGIIDVGGASSEVAVIENGKFVYSKSLALGAVRLKDAFAQNRILAEKFIETKIAEYGDIAKSDFYAIGGTATTIAAVLQELEPYDPTKTDGYKVSVGALLSLVDRLYSMSIEERKKLKGLQPERAEVIAGGALILLKIMLKIGLDYFTVSEKDNLEGYLIKKMEKK